jgi:hypothetical protein
MLKNLKTNSTAGITGPEFIPDKANPLSAPNVRTPARSRKFRTT